MQQKSEKVRLLLLLFRNMQHAASGMLHCKHPEQHAAEKKACSKECGYAEKKIKQKETQRERA